ncbi:MAG: DUF1905 domain-containing protein [Bdellovibrionales bacterium]|nr:DUF1905 domain-containing protein [Bdellovibrionales bacterium]
MTEWLRLEIFTSSKSGGGRLKATAVIGRTKWSTAIWFDTKAASYLLPIKTSVRKVEDICSGSPVAVTLYLRVEVKI